jgi:alkanesulfonate monooxygenase SsuD/methylene tetrahydromethanopterin reductase-like flavin-dependent oxidoreductase (luciferase family)
MDVMRKTAGDLGRDPHDVKVSITSSAIVGESEAEYREALAAAAAQRNKTPEELEETLASRRMLHGTFEQAADQIAEYGKEGVGRVYIQHFEPLREIDPGDLERRLRGLQG